VKTAMNLIIPQKAGYILFRYGTLRAPWFLYVSYFLIFISSKSRTSCAVCNTACSQIILFAFTFIRSIEICIKIKL